MSRYTENCSPFCNNHHCPYFSQMMHTTSWGRRQLRVSGTCITSQEIKLTKTGGGKYSRWSLSYINLTIINLISMLNHRALRSIAKLAEATRQSVTWETRWTPGPRTRWSPSSSARRSSTSTSCLRTDTSFPWTSGCSTLRRTPCPCIRTRKNHEWGKNDEKCTEYSFRGNFEGFLFYLFDWRKFTLLFSVIILFWIE